MNINKVVWKMISLAKLKETDYRFIIIIFTQYNINIVIQLGIIDQNRAAKKNQRKTKKCILDSLVLIFGVL